MTKEEGNNDTYENINKKQIGPTQNVTLNSKIVDIQNKMDIVDKEIQENIAEIKNLKEDKEKQQKILEDKTTKMKDELLIQLSDVEEQMTKHLNRQVEENNKLQKYITVLKGEKTVLMNKLIALQRRISDMEKQVGSDDLKFI